VNLQRGKNFLSAAELAIQFLLALWEVPVIHKITIEANIPRSGHNLAYYGAGLQGAANGQKQDENEMRYGLF
jgi:hypothetical protein